MILGLETNGSLAWKSAAWGKESSEQQQQQQQLKSNKLFYCTAIISEQPDFGEKLLREAFLRWECSWIEDSLFLFNRTTKQQFS